MSNLGRGRVLRARVESSTCAIRYYDPQAVQEHRFSLPAVPYLKCAAVHDAEGGFVTLFLLNRHLQEELALEVELRCFGSATVVSAETMRHDDLSATNTRDAPDHVAPQPLQGAVAQENRLQATLPAASWSVIRLKLG
jgi:alpha-N-arabinofuranosidase